MAKRKNDKRTNNDLQNIHIKLKTLVMNIIKHVLSFKITGVSFKILFWEKTHLSEIQLNWFTINNASELNNFWNRFSAN